MAVRDVRSVELHHRHRHAARRDPGAGRRRARDGCSDRRVPVTGMKLYNAGSFFDPRAVPDTDYDDVAEALAGLVAGDRRIASGAHRSAGRSIARMRSARRRSSDGPAIQLEVAMGLETAHPEALDRLNKRFTLEEFARAARALEERGVALRVFLLISPPFVAARRAGRRGCCASVDAAFACGAAVVSLVPTRPGNGAMEALAGDGLVHRARSRRHRAQLRAGA